MGRTIVTDWTVNNSPDTADYLHSHAAADNSMQKVPITSIRALAPFTEAVHYSTTEVDTGVSATIFGKTGTIKWQTFVWNIGTTVNNGDTFNLAIANQVFYFTVGGGIASSGAGVGTNGAVSLTKDTTLWKIDTYGASYDGLVLTVYYVS